MLTDEAEKFYTSMMKEIVDEIISDYAFNFSLGLLV